jgi:hypothetical protein
MEGIISFFCLIFIITKNSRHCGKHQNPFTAFVFLLALTFQNIIKANLVCARVLLNNELSIQFFRPPLITCCYLLFYIIPFLLFSGLITVIIIRSLTIYNLFKSCLC